MNRIAERLELVLLIVTGTALAVLMIVYGLVSADRGRAYSAELRPLEVPAGEAAIAAGARLAKIRGCIWCHGDRLEGKLYFAAANRGVIAVAPNLTRIVREYNPAEFARAFRHGIRPDATSLQPAMPSYAFTRVSDEDVGLLLAYIASLPEADLEEGRFDLLPVGWFRWVLGRLPPNVAEIIDHSTQIRARENPADAVDYGEYLAETICGECHSEAGREHHAPGTPDLIVASAYTREQLGRLLRTGKAPGDRPLDYLMEDVARYRFVHFTDAEIDALHAYFRALASVPLTAR